MARYQDEAGAWLLDPFHTAVVPEAETAAYLSKLFGREIRLGSDALDAVTPREIAARMLRNLRSVYVVNRDVDMVLRLLDLLVLAEPNAAMYWQERGYLAQSLDEYEKAVRSLRRAMFLSGQAPHLQAQNRVAAEPLDAEPGVEQALREIEQQWVRRN
jgi:regulator of sirC expression with transglutaminase-like and TPR domain